jgi:hypothetical protein
MNAETTFLCYLGAFVRFIFFIPFPLLIWNTLRATVIGWSSWCVMGFSGKAFGILSHLIRRALISDWANV